MSYFALNTKCMKQEKTRSSRISSHALINEGSPTDGFHSELCLSLVPRGFVNNPGKCTRVRLRTRQREAFSFVDYEKCDCEREWEKRICVMP